MHETSRKRPLGCGCCCDHDYGPEMVKKMPETLPLSYPLSVDPPEVLLTRYDPPRFQIFKCGTNCGPTVAMKERTESLSQAERSRIWLPAHLSRISDTCWYLQTKRDPTLGAAGSSRFRREFHDIA
ncbi:hypothetical protein MG293_011724 [Ovis ammon polii]|uniref:Uncharacterized protein n=1 Tax=Ovis ammon polii TaxID=230172 RepID=A0AAD4U4H2_OVIAM|nr:hypothetical protein MG293_011724 [Ovis ammon polii]